MSLNIVAACCFPSSSFLRYWPLEAKKRKRNSCPMSRAISSRGTTAGTAKSEQRQKWKARTIRTGCSVHGCFSVKNFYARIYSFFMFIFLRNEISETSLQTKYTPHLPLRNFTFQCITFSFFHLSVLACLFVPLGSVFDLDRVFTQFNQNDTICSPQTCRKSTCVHARAVYGDIYTTWSIYCIRCLRSDSIRALKRARLCEVAVHSHFLNV